MLITMLVHSEEKSGVPGVWPSVLCPHIVSDCSWPWWLKDNGCRKDVVGATGVVGAYYVNVTNSVGAF